MASPKREDVLYSFLRRSIRNALDLEYAIRASELISHREMGDLKRLESTITKFWRDRGVSEAEVRTEDLLDFAWDTLQVGFPLTRMHTRHLHPELAHVIREALATIRAVFAAELPLLAIPAARFFRVCDLLSGNDIPQVISQVKNRLTAARQYSKKDDVPLTEFRIKMREPIHLHPAFRYGMRERGENSVFVLEVDIAGEFDLFAWRRQLNEFQYYYALHRGWVTRSHDETRSELVQAFLEDEHNGSQSESDVPGLDSFLPLLIGIYCWDRYKRDHQTLSSAFEEAMGFHPRGPETMRLHYRAAAKRIQKLAVHFQSAAPGAKAQSAHGGAA